MLLCLAFLLKGPKNNMQNQSAQVSFGRTLILCACIFVLAVLSAVTIPSSAVSIERLYGSSIPHIVTGTFSEFSGYLATVCFGLLVVNLLCFFVYRASRRNITSQILRFTTTTFIIVLVAIFIFDIPLVTPLALQMSITISLLIIGATLIVQKINNDQVKISHLIRVKFSPMIIGFLIVPSLVYALGIGFLNASTIDNRLIKTASEYHGPYDVSCVPKNSKATMTESDYCWWNTYYSERPSNETLMLHQALDYGNLRAALRFFEWSSSRVGTVDLNSHQELVGRILSSLALHHSSENKRLNKQNATSLLWAAWKDHKREILNRHYLKIKSNDEQSAEEYVHLVNSITKKREELIE